MGLYDFKIKDIINARERFLPPKQRLEPPIDKKASAIAGQKIYREDPRLINLVVKFKKLKNNNNTADNFYQNPQFCRELKELFAKSL